MTQAVRSSTKVTFNDNPIDRGLGENQATGLSASYRAGAIAGVLMLALLIAILYSSTRREKLPLPARSASPGLSAPAGVPLSATSVTTPAPLVKRRTRSVSPTVHYVNSDYGVSFRYARKDQLLTGEAAQASAEGGGEIDMDFAEPGGERLASLHLGTQKYAETDLQSAIFNLSVHPDLTADKCSRFASSSQELAQGGTLSWSSARVGAMSLEGITDAGSGGSKYYHVFRGGTCYEFALALTTRPAKDDADQKPVNRMEVFAELDQILASVTIDGAKTENRK